MKPAFDITLTEVHSGQCRTVVTLGLNGHDPADDFLNKLLRDDVNRFNWIQTRLRTVANYDRYENRTTFRHVGKGVYEFKRPGLRLYAFYDDIEGVGHLILCTNGGTKNTRKGQQSDITEAKKRKADYFAAKADPGTQLTYVETDS